MLLMGRILGACWACENLDLGVLPDCHAEGRSMSMVAKSYLCTIRSEDNRPALLTALPKIVCKVHREGTLAVTGRAGVLTLSADAGFCRVSGKLENVIECTRNTILDCIVDGTIFNYKRRPLAVADMLWYGTADPLATYTRHIAVHSILRHTIHHSKKLGGCGLSQKSKRRRPSLAPPKVLGLPLGAIHPIRGLPFITTATLALIVLAEQRYKFESRFSLLAEISILSLDPSPSLPTGFPALNLSHSPQSTIGNSRTRYI